MSEESPAGAVSTEAASGTINSLGRTLSSVLEAGREILARRGLSPSNKAGPAAALVELCRELLDHRGEASGLALASEITRCYRELPESERTTLFDSLASEFEVDPDAVQRAAEHYREETSQENLAAIARAVEAPRQKLFRRINTAPDGTATLVTMRGHLLPLLRSNPQYRGLDSDLKHLFISWFNKGFLELRRVDWSSPAMVLERIIDYEAVHEINGWDDLRNRLREDRRCFAFFHPALRDDPLVFVEIALTDELPGALAPLVTLSPVPGFRKWLLSTDLDELVPEEQLEKVKQPVGKVVETDVYETLLRLCAHYLLKVKSGELPMDPVARFHLGNGARLHRIHGGADLSTKGREQSGGIMVNYLYDLDKIEEYHEAYFDQGVISASRSVIKMLD
jgi:malonyl-CoA decarboxylase